jgi:hypothetical protein
LIRMGQLSIQLTHSFIGQNPLVYSLLKGHDSKPTPNPHNPEAQEQCAY